VDDQLGAGLEPLLGAEPESTSAQVLRDSTTESQTAVVAVLFKSQFPLILIAGTSPAVGQLEFG
jgi:hypothetical protein